MIKEFFKSTFRTLGRVFAYVVLGILAYFILTWFGITNAKAQAIDYLPNLWYVGSYECPSNNNYCAPTNNFGNKVDVRYFDSSHIFLSGHTYNVQFIIKTSWSGTTPPGLNPKVTAYSLYVYNGTDYIRATPDRYESVDNVIQQGDDYYFGWSFQLDVTFDVDFLWFYNTLNIYPPNAQVTFTIEDVASQSDTQIITDTIYFNSENIINNQNNNFNNLMDDLDLKFDDLNDNLVSESPADISILQNINNYMPSNAPLTNIITLPLTILALELNSLGGTCRAWSINMGSLFNNYILTIPCINPGVYLSGYSWGGYDLWNLIDLMCVMFMGYEILMLIIAAWEDITSLEDTFDGLYQPRHKGYKTQHNGERV